MRRSSSGSLRGVVSSLGEFLRHAVAGASSRKNRRTCGAGRGRIGLNELANSCGGLVTCVLMDRGPHRRAAAVFGQSERLEGRTLLTSTVTISASSSPTPEFIDSSGIYQFFSVFRTGDVSAAETVPL